MMLVNGDEENWLVVSNMAFIVHFIYRVSSFPLTFIFFKMVDTTNQKTMGTNLESIGTPNKMLHSVDSGKGSKF